MSITRNLDIPFSHFLAELASFPLASSEALSISPISLDFPGTSDHQPKVFIQLWRAAEKVMLRKFPNFSIDELIYSRDLLWFYENKKRQIYHSIHLSQYLYNLASRCLIVEGSVAKPDIFKFIPFENINRSKTNEKEHSRTFWRWLTLSLPPDLLLAGFSINDYVPYQVETMSPLLKQLLEDKRFCEVHLHLGASMDFSLFWEAIQQKMTDKTLSPDFLESPGAQLNEGRDFGHWLIRCLLGRHILYCFLNSSRRDTFAHYFGNTFKKKMIDQYGICNYQLITSSLLLFAQGTNTLKNFKQLQHLYISLSHVLISKHLIPETEWMSRGLNYTHTNPEDIFFARIFWQTIRVRCLLYRHIVQRPMTPGLQWFFRFYERIRSVSDVIPIKKRVDKAIRLCGKDKGLESLEIRTSMKRNGTDVLSNLSEIVDITKSIPEFGVVFHFTRDRGHEARKGLQLPHGNRNHADPRPETNQKYHNNLGYRFRRYYLDRRSEAIAMGRILLYYPYNLYIFRGIDLCSDEIGVPHWVFVPLLNFIRKAGELASLTIKRISKANVPPLRTTLHIGEDFVHLMGGLRRVDQAIDFLGLREGDRIGHALTLGINAKKWAEKTQFLFMPKEDRLLDLIWEWSWYASNNNLQPVHRRHMYLEKEICRLSWEIFKEELHPFQVHKFVIALHKEHSLRACDFPYSHPKNQFFCDDEKNQISTMKLVYRYLTSPGVYQRGQQLEMVDTTDEGDVLEDLQTGLRSKVASMGISVEVNPSSNLLVGNFSDLEQHPFWRLNPPEASSQKKISVVIGSDDPLIFATDLPNEYQLLRDTLINAGVSDDQTMKWLEEVRNKGFETRFTLKKNDPQNPFNKPKRLKQHFPLRESIIFPP